MESNRNRQMRRQLRRRAGWGQMALLGILAVTLLNQILLWCGIGYHFLFSAAMPYYLNWLAGQLPGAGLKVIVTLVTLALYGGFGLCLLRSGQRKWYWNAMVLYGVDTAALIVFALALLENPVSCLLEVLVHGLALGLLAYSWKARLMLMRLPPRVRRENTQQ